MVGLDTIDGGQALLVFDMVPRVMTEEKTGTSTVGIGLNFKFASARAETIIDLRQAVPVTTADGIGESTARWVFVSTRAHPLTGSQTVFAMVELPQGAKAARASLHLSVEVATRLGPIRGLLPRESEAYLSWELK